MTIPRKIHYCWFGGNELPDLAIHCINSWKIHCPDYEVICWDETNSDLSSCEFVIGAYNQKKWAFVSDYIRLKVIAEHGGIYLDVDVELLKPLDIFLELDSFMGFEESRPYYVNSGLGFGASKNNENIKKLMENYEQASFFNSDGTKNLTTCLIRDTEELKKIGLIQNNKKQIINQMTIFPSEYFCPISNKGYKSLTCKTVSIHHFNGSWLPTKVKIKLQRRRKLIKIYGELIGTILYFVISIPSEIKELGVLGLMSKSIKLTFKIFNRKSSFDRK